jgi:hypothetical protein
MSEHTALRDEVLRLAEGIPEAPSLRQAQYAYRQIIFFMGLKILETFPEAAIGLPPSGRGDHESHEREALAETIDGVVQAEVSIGMGRGSAIAAGGGGGPTGGGHINAIVGKIVGIVLGLTPPPISPTPPPKLG